jgi:hypothetical protein
MEAIVREAVRTAHTSINVVKRAPSRRTPQRLRDAC